MHGVKRRATSFNTSLINHLYQDPHESDPRMVLLFDEATSALDPVTVQPLMEAIERASKQFTIVMIAHMLSAVERYVLEIKLYQGCLVSDDPP